jgi:hypothetical protein
MGVGRPVGLLDLTYDAQVSALLAPESWQGISSGTELFRVDPLDTGRETAIFRSLTPIPDSGPQIFLRLEVELDTGN